MFDFGIGSEHLMQWDSHSMSDCKNVIIIHMTKTCWFHVPVQPPLWVITAMSAQWLVAPPHDLGSVRPHRTYERWNFRSFYMYHVH